MSKLFDYKDVKVSTSRNGFDNAGKRAFTAKVGELLPIWWTRLIPGDTVQGTVQHFTRTRPVNSPAFTRIREYFDFVVVPIDQLWKSFPTAVTLMQENNLQAVSMSENLQVTDQMPYLTLNQLVSLKSGSSSVLSKLSSGDPFNPQYYRKNYFGFNRMFLTSKLFSYLRYCKIYDDIFNQNFVAQIVHSGGDVIKWSFPVDIFPLLAYQKAYNDLYRHSQWESANPFTWNVDYSSGGQLTLPDSSSYWDNNTMFDLRYANFNKDLFMGLLPESQFGDVASIDMQFNLSSIPVTLDVTGTATFTNGQLQGNVSSGDGTAPSYQRLGVIQNSDSGQGRTMLLVRGDGSSSVPASDTSTNLQVTGSINISNLVASGQIDSSGFAASYSILALRMQEALQRWKEVAQCGNQDYRDQVYRQFGVTLPDELSGLAEFVGGDASNLNIDEVVNQNLSEGNSTDIQGKGVGVGQFNVNYTAKRHSIMLCIYHAVPLLDYDISGIDKKLFATSAYDYPIPAFDKIGFEELSLACFTNAGYRVSGYDDEGNPTYLIPNLPDEPVTMGYVPRYVEQKTDIDVVLGDFVVSTKNWVAPVNDDYLFENLPVQQYDINYNFFKVNPHILDPIFAVAADSSVKTDQLLVNSYLDIKKVSNLDYNGLPY